MQPFHMRSATTQPKQMTPEEAVTAVRASSNRFKTEAESGDINPPEALRKMVEMNAKYGALLPDITRTSM